MSRATILTAALVLALIASSRSAMADGSQANTGAQQSRGSNAATPCPDYGSYAVVDGSRRSPRGVVGAEPYNTCADLPSQTQQPQIYIGADVQIGNGNNSDTSQTQGGNTSQGQGQQSGMGRPANRSGSGMDGNGMIWTPQVRPVLQPRPMHRP